MAELYDVVVDTVKGIVNNMDITGVAYATVISVQPLNLEIQATRLRVSEPVAVITDVVRRHAINIQGEEFEINPGLKKGDKVLTLKANAGQNYIVLSKI